MHTTKTAPAAALAPATTTTTLVAGPDGSPRTRVAPVVPTTPEVWIVSEGEAYRDCGRIPGGRYGYDWIAVPAVDETDALRQARDYDLEGTGPDGGARTLRRLRRAVLACGPSDALREVLAPPRYEARGARGACGHAHKDLASAVACAERNDARSRRAGGIGDYGVGRVGGGHLSDEDEQLLEQLLEDRA